jgi:Cu/Ag efflux pump CusA
MSLIRTGTPPRVVTTTVPICYEKQYHVQPDPMKLASLDLSFADVARALEANNANQVRRSRPIRT